MPAGARQMVAKALLKMTIDGRWAVAIELNKARATSGTGSSAG
jgi:hypothetical protein